MGITRPLVLSGVNVIDGISPAPIRGASVTIEDGRIAEVVDGSKSPDTRDAQVLELDGAYLLPGCGMCMSIQNTLSSRGATSRTADG